MEEETVEQIAQNYVAMGHSVDEINGGQHADEDDAEWVLRKARNIDHLVIMKAKDYWTTEDFTAIDAAIAS
tara:strand:+ start:1494 stop:1706 length:213 start_codon:yes stop_codon:yes gene_type:complete